MYTFKETKSLSDVKKILQDCLLNDSQFVAWVNSKVPITQKVIKSYISVPTCEPAPSYPTVLDGLPLGFIASAYSQIKAERSTLNNANGLSAFVAYSNITPSYKVNYLAGKVTTVDEAKVETAFTSHADMIATPTPGVFPHPPNKLEAVEKVVMMGEFQYLQESHETATFVARVITSKAITVKELVSSGMVCSPPATVLAGVGVPFETKGSVLEQIRTLASFPAIVEIMKRVAEKQGIIPTIPPPRLPDCGYNYALYESVLQAYNPNRHITNLFKFYDIPAQWLNAPMKWGAIISYFNNGTLTNPVPAPVNSDYYGAKGGRAFQLFTKCACFDIETFTELQFGKNVDEAKKTLMKNMQPRWTMKNLFDYNPSDRFLFSDVWSPKFGESNIADLVRLVSPRSCIKFVGHCPTVLAVITELKRFPVVVLTTSRPLFTEYFLTQRLFEQQDPEHVGRYINVCRDATELANCFRDMYIRVLTMREYYKTMMIQNIRAQIKKCYRPFPVYDWMMPMLITTGRNKALEGKTKHLDLNELARITGMSFLQEELILEEDIMQRSLPTQTPPPRVQSIQVTHQIGGGMTSIVDNSTSFLDDVLAETGAKAPPNLFGGVSGGVSRPAQPMPQLLVPPLPSSTAGLIPYATTVAPAQSTQSPFRVVANNAQVQNNANNNNNNSGTSNVRANNDDSGATQPTQTTISTVTAINVVEQKTKPKIAAKQPKNAPSTNTYVKKTDK